MQSNQDVHVYGYMVANLILLCSLKTYLSFETWKQLCKKTWAIVFAWDDTLLVVHSCMRGVALEVMLGQV